MFERSRFATPFGSQRVNGSQSLLKSSWHHFYTIAPSIWNNLSCKKLALVRFEILRLFLNKMTTDDKISLRNRNDFAQHIQMHKSQEPKPFSSSLFAFLKSTSNFEYFHKEGGSDSLSISEIIDSERDVFLNV